MLCAEAHTCTVRRALQQQCLFVLACPASQVCAVTHLAIAAGYGGW